VHGDADLAQIAHAFRPAAAFPRARKSWQKQGRKDGDDRDDDQKFDQGESLPEFAQALK